MSNKNQQQMNQAQKNRFASLPSRTNNIKNQQAQAEQVEQSQPQPPIPQTIILESNRLTSRQDDENAENYNTNHRWTTEYSNGGIQIRKGDEIRINSAYISSIGVGDLIEWDVRDDSATQDNKASWIFSYYGCNDHLNDKRAGYNIKEISKDISGTTFNYGGNGRFNFDCDNSPCPLMRITPSLTLGTTTSFAVGGEPAVGEFQAERLSWFQDPYLKCRFYGDTFTIHTPLLDDHYEFILIPKLHLADTGDTMSHATAIAVYHYASAGSAPIIIDPRRIMGLGQTLNFISQSESYNTSGGNNPNSNFFQHNENDWVFTIQDFRVGHADNGGTLANANVLIVDSLNNLTGLNFPQSESITNTAKVLIGNMPSICSSSETGIDYPHTALSTIIFTGASSTGDLVDNYIEVGDKLKQYSFAGVNFATLDTFTAQFNLVTQVNDTQSADQSIDVQVASSTQTEAETKIKLNIISLTNLTGAGANSKQQRIQFQFELNSVEDIAMKASGVGHELTTFTTLIGTNCLVFDLYGGENSGAVSEREIAVCNLYTSSNNYSNFTYDRDANIIKVQNCRRNQNSQNLLNVLSSGQPVTANIIVDNTQDYYLIKTPNFFTDITANFINPTHQQFRGETWDWSTKLALPININNRIGYLGYMKNNHNELTEPNLTILNNRGLLHSSLQSNSFNFQNPNGNVMINKPMKYAGYFNNNTSHIEVKHFAQHELKIEENYSSPSDIATALTEQTHAVGKAINKNGIEVANSENNGIIQNSYYIPVWSSAGNLTDTSVDATTDNQNEEDSTTGKLKGTLQANSFMLRYKMKDSAGARYSPITDQVYADDGDYDIYFKTHNTFINQPIAFHDDDKGYLKTNTADETEKKFSLTADLDQRQTTEGKKVNASQALSILQTAKCFTESSTIDAQVINGFPIKYAPDCFLSQYCGSNNVSISWDDTNSRFKIDFLHQPAVSKFEPTAEGIVQEGGQLSATIYYPAPVGKAGNLYKLPRTRCGGINIENWSSHDFSGLTIPQQIRELCNLDSTIDLGTEWFVVNSALNPNSPQLQNNYLDIGNRFWNKLGFINSQLYTTLVGSSYDSRDRYIPNGTTDNLLDIADALITAEEPAENTPFFFIKEKFDGAKVEPATNEFGSVGGLNFNSHLSGYGIPNTTGVPITFISNETIDNLNLDQVDVNADSYKKDRDGKVDVTRPPFSSYLSTYNPDREMNTGYSFTTEPNSMTALSLPIKTEFPYFYVMSDLIETDFNISANKGTSLNCLGVISKLNAEGDFFFQYQAPQSFFATKDKLISSITTELRTPTLGIPQALSPFSSVIYQITRYAPTPIQVSPPTWVEQNMVFEQMKNLLQDIATSLSPAIPVSADQQISDSMGGQIQGVLPDAPIQINPADERDLYQSMINSISGRITEPIPAVQRALPSLRNIQNPLELTNDPAPELTEQQQLDYELAVRAIRGNDTAVPINSDVIPIELAGLRNTNRNTISQINNQIIAPRRVRFDDTGTQYVGSNDGSVGTLETQEPPLPAIPTKPDEDIPSMLGDSVVQSSVPPSYRGRSLPSYATGSLAPTYTSALTDVSGQTIRERIEEERKEEEEMD